MYLLYTCNVIIIKNKNSFNRLPYKELDKIKIIYFELYDYMQKFIKFKALQLP